jgi:hypothetical protein
MSHVTVRISSTIGSATTARDCAWIRGAGAETAIGWGHVVGTLCPDGDEAEALVVMREPALPGADVAAEPVALLHVTGSADREEILCVADDPTLSDLVHGQGVLPSDGPMRAWAGALARLTAEPVDVYDECGSRADAENALAHDRLAYLRSTGYLD